MNEIEIRVRKLVLHTQALRDHNLRPQDRNVIHMMMKRLCSELPEQLEISDSAARQDTQ